MVQSINNRTHAPIEMMHKKVVRDIAKAVDHAYYGASMENVSCSETSEAIAL